jgi:hypothetical protein
MFKESYNPLTKEHTEIKVCAEGELRMNIVRMILKEAGGRFENAAGAIDSKDNMFRGSSGNAISDKLGGGGNNNPVMAQEETQTEETTETPATETTPEVDTASTTDATEETETFSDERLKDGYSDYKNSYRKMESKPLAGKLRNLDLDPMSQKSVTSNGSSGGGMGGMMKMFQGFGGGAGGEGAEGAGDMGADMGDMADAADAASDERLKRIFGDNEDAIKCFADINAIKFTYNDKAHEIPGSEEKGVDNDPHYGVKAQELAENPLTQTAVSKDPISEYLQVDTKELTMANTAIISEICKRILIIEKVLGIKVV